MTDENVIEQAPVEEVSAAAVEAAPTEVASAAPVPEKKKRGRKPKVPVAPPAPVVEAPRLVRKRRNGTRISSTERAIGAALAVTEKERTKCIDELSKIMEMWDVKQARLKSLDWKISNLKGTTSTSSIAGMQLQSYAQPSQAVGYPMPQYPQQAYPPAPTAFIPPSMRTPAIPAVPQAGGGAVGGGFETEQEDPDQFLKVGGVVGSEKGWA